MVLKNNFLLFTIKLFELIHITTNKMQFIPIEEQRLLLIQIYNKRVLMKILPKIKKENN